LAEQRGMAVMLHLVLNAQQKDKLKSKAKLHVVKQQLPSVLSVSSKDNESKHCSD
jgi:hypothetical protein